MWYPVVILNSTGRETGPNVIIKDGDMILERLLASFADEDEWYEAGRIEEDADGRYVCVDYFNEEGLTQQWVFMEVLDERKLHYVMKLGENDEVLNIQGAYFFKDAKENVLHYLLHYEGENSGSEPLPWWKYDYACDYEHKGSWSYDVEEHHDNTRYYTYNEFGDSSSETPTLRRRYAIADVITYRKIWWAKVKDEEMARNFT